MEIDPVDDADASQRLAELEARWESDKGSRVFLQLADEYRRQDRPADAVRVLDEGLERSPGHLGARVARARSLLELGRTDDAVADLERVIDADPTQMVAQRLLVEAHVERGDGEAASESLRIYRMLNDSDPAIPELERRIAELGEGGAEVPEGPPPAAGGAEEPAGERAAVEGDEEEGVAFPEVEEADRPPHPAEDRVGSAPEGRAGTGESAPPPGLATGVHEPFPGLGSAADRRRYLESLEGDLFAPTPAAGPEPVPPRAPEEPGAPEPFDLPPVELEEAPPESFDLEPPAAAEPVAPAPAPPGVDVPAEATAEPETEPEGGEERATVTLARLYQRQGHHEEAAEIYRKVLEREPQDEEAARALEEIEAAREQAGGPEEEGLRAEELLEGYDPAEHGDGLTARRRYALRRYLARLRSGSGKEPGDVR